MMPIIRGSYLALRIGFKDPLAPNAPFPVAMDPLAPFGARFARRGKNVSWRVGPSKSPRKSDKRKESLYKSM